MRRHHDLGGLEAGALDLAERPHAPWEKRVQVVLGLLLHGPRPLIKVDELRRAIEDLGAEEYDRLGYYERWIAAIAQLLIEKGVIEVDALGRRMTEVEARFRAAGRPS